MPAQKPVAEAVHLAKRFFGSLKPDSPPEADEQWALSHLEAGERLLWERLDNPDRRHAVGVGRAVVAKLGAGIPREVVAAALLHDVGKVQSGFGTLARVGATLVWAVLPDHLADGWLEAGGVRLKLAQYRRHPQIGEALLVEAGAHSLTAQWAADHHKPATAWRIDHDVAAVLKACDND